MEMDFPGSSGDDSFKCPACGKEFTTRASLMRHTQTIHETRQIFPCRLCQLSFKRKYDLARHTRVHDKVRQFLCDNCGRAFSRKDNLNLHRRMKHGTGPAKRVQGQAGQGQVAGDKVEGEMMAKRGEGQALQGQVVGGQGESQVRTRHGPLSSIHQRHFVGGRGPTPEHPDPVPFNPLNAARPESSRFQANIAGFGVSGEPSGTSSVVDPSVSIQEVKPHIVNRLDLDLAGPPNSLPHPAPAPANRNPSYTFRPSFAQQRIARAQQIHHGNSQVASRPGMQSRPPQGLQSRPPQGMQSRPPQGMQHRARMPAPSATVTSAAPPLKRPRLETQRAVPQTNRQMGQAPVQRQNMSTFDQSHRMPAPRSVVRSPQRPVGVQQMSTQQARPMQHRQVSRSPQRQIARSKQQISQSRNSEPKSDSTERAFLNPDHSSHIMTELSALWKSGKFVDAAIMVGGMKLQAHRMVLFAASPYLRASFDHLNPATELRLKMPSDIKLDIVYQFLTYIYDGILRLNPNNAFSLLKISLMLRMEHLTMCCQEYMTYAVNSGTIQPMAVKDVKSPLLVLVDQKAQETGQGKADMCTQTMSDSEPSTIRSPPKVDFDRVFGEEDQATTSYHSNQFDHSVQSDMDLYQNYDQGLGDGGGGGRVVHTQDDGDAMPMIIVKNECIDPEYELSINPPHLTSPPPDLDNMSPASNQSEPRSDTEQHMSSQTDPIPDTDISSPAAQAGVEAMQVVPGIDLDVSSPDTPDHDLEQSTNGSVHQSPLTSTFDQSQVGTSAFDQSQVSTSAFDQSTSSTSTDQLHSLEQSSVSQSETIGTPSYTFTSESNIAEGYDESFSDRTSDNSHTNTEDQTSAFTHSAPDQSLPLVESGDHATPQFGTEEFLSSDFDVQMSNAPKSEPDDPV